MGLSYDRMPKTVMIRGITWYGDVSPPCVQRRRGSAFVKNSFDRSTRYIGFPTDNNLTRFRVHVEDGLRFSDLNANDLLGNNGRYCVEKLLGQGGNASTYKCWDKETESFVAIKALSFRRMRTWKQLELFEREASVLQQMDFPSIPRYLDYFEVETKEDKLFYIVQELADGLSLQQMQDAKHGWTDAEIEHIFLEMLKTLSYLSSLRPPVIHRDIKPGNIIVESPDDILNSKIMLVDFGGVQATEPGNDVTIVGTFDFMAPEQLRGRARVSSDLYGLGATMLYLATGRMPSQFPERRMKLDLSSVVMKDTLKAAVAGLLETIPEDRLDANKAIDILRSKTISLGRVGGSRFGRTSSIQQSNSIRKPVGTKVVVQQSEDSLTIYIPPASFDSNSISNSIFALVWNGFVGAWTVSAFASGGILFGLFSIPFWMAGATLAKTAIGRQFVYEKLVIGSATWKLEKKLALLSRSPDRPNDVVPNWTEGSKKQQIGYTSDLSSAEISISGYVNGIPQTKLIIKHGIENLVMGEGLDPVEQQWIASQVNQFLENLSDAFTDT